VKKILLASLSTLALVVFVSWAHAAGSAKRSPAQASGKSYYSTQLSETLTINDDGSATLSGVCGHTSFSNWSTDGHVMDGEGCGGPTCSIKNSVKATAHMRHDDVVLNESGHQYLFLPSKGGFTGMECL
jgi:hypothetical protein